ncbi:MAG: manno-octulosonate cytidylyltransferase [Paracoccaceae bacterium]|jgi:3-deoxy-manno-octulosonate cytidylyltransferase (CMP-KDO synthetase)
MSVLLVIPARYASNRFDGKPFVGLRGAGGESRSLIQRTWAAAQQVTSADRVVFATDDTCIRFAAEAFGAEVVMTSASCRNGTERCAEVAEILNEYGIIVNLQGDAPLTPPWFVDAVVAAMDEPDIAMATPVLRCDASALNGFQEDRENGRVGGTTAVFDASGKALYFSKEVLPYTGRRFQLHEDVPVFHHVGVYAYRTAALRQYPIWAEGKLEHWQGLEQLRFMENNVPVQCVEVEAKGRAFWELNNPVDVARIEKILRDQGMA